MAGKSNKARNRKASHAPANSSQPPVSLEASHAADSSSQPPVSLEASHAPDNSSQPPVSLDASANAIDTAVCEANGIVTSEESTSTPSAVTETESSNESNPPKQGELHLYPVSVKTLGGEKLELQLNPGDSVMDVRQFLLDAPETCYFTCYDLLLHAKDSAVHQLEDYNEISEVADITTGDCSLEMVAAYYDDRSVRAHIHRTRELLSLSNLHASLSTSLALQHETSLSASEGAQDSVKAEVRELDSFGFMEDVIGSLNKLFSTCSKEIKCVESIVFSSFNPPPSHRRLVGDLLYLDVTTLEGGLFCITGTTRMFYVNSSAGNTLDPRPSKASLEATTLIGLLQRISSKFKKAFREVLEQKATAHPFENVQSLLPPNSWLGSYPLPEHKRDAARAENALTLTYGSELIGMQRDWNEELQSCREFPHSTPQERILRDRALYKVTSDFVDAATDGAIGVINKCIPPINPTDPECFHMYVHNNIFFSFAVDADLEQLPRTHIQNTDLKSNITAIRHNHNGKTLNKSSDGAADICNGVEANASKRDDKNGAGNVATDVSAEIQLADSEQATYASANNDLKGTKAYQEADVPGLYNLAMAIIDYRGHRVVAQSVLPGILQGDKSDSLLYGSVDNGKKICWNEDFHLKVLEAAKCLHLKEHTVLDESGNSYKLAGPVECKGIVGSDDRHYLLDLMRVTPRDANYTGAGSRFCILRPELIRAFCQAEAAKRPTCKSKTEENDCLASELSDDSKLDLQSGDVSVDLSSQDINKETSNDAEEVVSAATEIEASEQICFNPNVFTEFKLDGSPQEIASDENNVRQASSYLTDIVLPKFIQDLCTLEVSPMDGQTLAEALHAHGINVRYIGKVAEGTRHMPHLWDLCTNEMAVRAAKHLLKDIVRDTDDHELAPSVAHFFNCFFGNSQVVSEKNSNSNSLRRSQKKEQGGHQKSAKGKYRSRTESFVKKCSPLYMGLSSEGLWSDILEFSKIKYQFDLPEDARNRVKLVSVIRNLCHKVGISLAARKYDLTDERPFQTSDILNLQPVVKHSIPVCSEAKDLVETGKVQLAEGMLGEAYTAFSEAFSILQQVTGPMHREVANCCRYLAMVLYHAGDMAGAIMQQHKELIINERCLGLDHPDTAHSYGNMALFYHGLNQTELALRHMSRALLLLSLSSGPDHPDVAATFINVAMMYQDIGKMDTALRYLQEALKKNERLLGEEHIQTAVCYHALAIAFNCMGAYKLSHQHEKKTYEILVKQLGEDDSRTRDSQNWMNTFKKREDQMNAQKQKGQALDATAARRAVDILKGLQAAAAAGGSRSSSVSMNKSLNAAMIGETVPRGRGVDERAARAAASIRKKADARRQLPRTHVTPVQPGSQLLNIRSSGMVPESKEGGEVNKQRKGISPAVGPEDPTEKIVQGEQPNEAPVGLGKGLGSLDAKKQKNKPKGAS
ncbi:clustered mitochondria protein-like isoform X2 [Chenopodium quinoa]|uniref:clustered mitochondria protein-like isoform X2 n=1 Tax=Chenopodium quinoa TaxID=63459 RepID=UPI000B786819|nr:clustered mitochondria protein-like isoform X2 [Chenopodium quinoa]